MLVSMQMICYRNWKGRRNRAGGAGGRNRAFGPVAIGARHDALWARRRAGWHPNTIQLNVARLWPICP